MLKIENLSSGYSGKKIIKDINLELKPGILYSLMGPNGSGKSTLLKTLAKIIKPITGSIWIEDRNLEKLSLREAATLIAYLPQVSNSFPGATVFDSILLGRKPHFSFEPSSKDLETVERIINEFALNKFAFRKINELSGGEAQKALIARALVQEPKVLLLDEPVNHLDPKNQIEILKLLRKVSFSRNMITLIVLHDINLALQFSDYLIFLKEGTVYKEGSIDIIDPPLIKEIYGVETEVVKIKNIKFVLMQ